MRTLYEVAKKSKLYEEVSRHIELLCTGTVLVVDPSIGSSSSSPGWAVYQKGHLSLSGTIDTGGSHLPLWRRARRLGEAIAELSLVHQPDILVYEDIPATSGYNQNAVASLLKAVGIVLACSKSEECIGIHPASWKNYVRPSYTKGDEEDAIEIGYIVTSLAAIIKAARESDNTRSKVSSGSNRSRR